MEDRNNITTIFKSNDPEKLVIFHAASLQDQIRFYLNDTQYIAAVDCEEGYQIIVGEEVQEKEEIKKSTISIIRENLNQFIKLFSLCIGIFALGILLLFYLITIIDNILVYVVIMHIVYLIINVVIVVILESKETAPSLKSKHSAEHMMVNFLEINRRLPKNIEEVKKCSRFTPECGSQDLVEKIAANFIKCVFASIFSFIISEIVLCFYDNAIVNEIVFLLAYYPLSFVLGKLIKKYKKIEFIIRPMKKVLTYIAQCANTTNKVKDRDIILAYSVASPWVQVVYPEFYNQDADVYWKQYFLS